jgi:hypothetical protein
MLDLRGRRFYSFTLPSTRTVRVTVEQLETAPAATLVLGLGVPSGTGCAVWREVDAAASEEPQFNEELTVGTYCAQLSDPGVLMAPAAFSIRIEFP